MAEKEEATINPKNKDDKCFQYALAVALNYQNINKDPQRMSKIKPFIDQYNWKEKSFSSHGKDWKNFELNNKLIVLNFEKDFFKLMLFLERKRKI